MTEHRHYSGPDLAPLLRQVRDELGSAAEIVRAERIRSGGLAGFFAREHYEVVAKRTKVEPLMPPASSDTVAPALMRPDQIDEPMEDEPISNKPIADEPGADEPIASRSTTLPEQVDAAASTRAEPGSARSMAPGSTDPAGAEPVPDSVGTGRSIQAALLDRADRVSTEELLVRVAETHAADWESESFQSILGRAMVDAVGPSVDEDPGRRGVGSPEPAADAPTRTSVGGLRFESIRPGERVVDPTPQIASAEIAADEHETTTRSSDLADGLRTLATEQIPPQWANGIPPSWGPPWMAAWSPWMVNGWPQYVPEDTAERRSAPHLCANCAGALDLTGEDDVQAVADGERASDRGVDPSWSELRREIDDVRHLLDDIIGSLHRAAGNEAFQGGSEVGTRLVDRRRPTADGSEAGSGQDRNGR